MAFRRVVGLPGSTFAHGKPAAYIISGHLPEYSLAHVWCHGDALQQPKKVVKIVQGGLCQAHVHLRRALRWTWGDRQHSQLDKVAP